MLVAGIAVFWVYDVSPLISASGLVGVTILSRAGLRGFDLFVQPIVQEASHTDPMASNSNAAGSNQSVEAESRGPFSSVEAAWQIAFELLAYASIILFYRPSQFKWPSLISVIAVMSASTAYTVYVYLRRGHLLHFDVLTGFSEQKQHDRGIAGINSRSDI